MAGQVTYKFLFNCTAILKNNKHVHKYVFGYHFQPHRQDLCGGNLQRHKKSFENKGFYRELSVGIDIQT
jgi:hypothetical protein